MRNDWQPEDASIHSRRHFFEDCGIGVGRMALAGLLARSGQAVASATNPTAPKAPHFVPKAKRVIFLFMAGAPSQLELFDYKPKLAELEGTPIPPSIVKDQRYAFIQPNAAVLGPQFRFKPCGDNGTYLSEMLPKLSTIVDRIAIVRSVQTDLFNHAPAQLLFNTGSGIPGRPSIGAWLSYGLGSPSDDLPAFVVLHTGGNLSGGVALWGSGFLPSTHQGVPFRGQGDPILHLSNPNGVDRRAQRDSLNLIRTLNETRLAAVGDPEISTRIAAYEKAFRMQARAPELVDLSSETDATMKMYGIDREKSGTGFAKNCLLARRMAERGVRFIQVYHEGWDHHSNVKGGVQRMARSVDRASTALILDLEQRGLLDETLVVWGGEFGRTPMIESSGALNRSRGRDHHPKAFSMWLAGGGIRQGVNLGKTDELGFDVVEDPVHVHDLQATLLHCLGIDHERLTFKFRGLEFRLTGVEEHHPVDALLA